MLPATNFNPNKEVKIITVTATNGIHFKVSSYGAGLLELFLKDKNGKTANIVYRFENIEDYWSEKHDCYMGVTMGRFSRCIEKGRFFSNNQSYQLSLNENGHHFHGGSVGFDKYNWDTTVAQTETETSVIFSLKSMDGDEGYPGNVTVTATYTLNEKNQFSISYSGVSDKDTLLSLSNHAFWNLASTGTIDSHFLEIPSEKYVPANSDFIPNEKPKSNKGTDLDFSRLRQIKKTKIDQCFVLNQDDGVNPIRFYHPQSGRNLEIITNQPILAVYTGDHLPAQRAGITFQSGAYPNAPNYMAQASAIIKAEEKYHHYFKITFSIK